MTYIITLLLVLIAWQLARMPGNVGEEVAYRLKRWDRHIDRRVP
jgi:hypothetical protein